MFRRVFPVVAAPARAALNSSPFFSTLASAASPSASGCVSASASSSSSSTLMVLASALSSSLRRRSFSSDAPAGDAVQHKAPHGWGQTRVAELLESKVRGERRWEWEREEIRLSKCPCHRFVRPCFFLKQSSFASSFFFSSLFLSLSKQGSDRGAWLWCSKDDFVIEAVRKVGKWTGEERRKRKKKMEKKLGDAGQGFFFSDPHLVPFLTQLINSPTDDAGQRGVPARV